MSFNIEIAAGSNKRLLVGGKYCTEDIVVSSPYVEGVKPEVELNLDITENGAQVHTPAEGTVYNKVSFNVNVPQGEGGTDNSVLASLIDRSITKIEIPKGITAIGKCAFLGCAKINTIDIPEGITAIGDSAFSGCAKINAIDIPEGVITIGQDAFKQCTSMETLTLPQSLKSIDRQSLMDCYSLKRLVLPPKVTVIPVTFASSCGMTEFVAEGDIKTINGYAFQHCSRCLSYDFSNCTSVPTLLQTTSFINIPAKCKIYVPASLYDQWIVATNWAQYADYIVGVRGEGDPSEGLDMYLSWDGTRYSLIGIGTCTDTEIVIPNEYNGLPVTDIVDGFSDNKDITKVVFGSNINYIEYWTFDGCSNCKTYDFSRVTQIPYCGSTSFGGSSEDDPFYSVYPFDNPEDLPEGTRFIVPASLYDAWKTETNWCLYADYIVAAE